MEQKAVLVDKIGVFLRPNTPTLKDSFTLFVRIANDFGIETRIESKSAEMIGESNGIRFAELCAWSDVLVSIGGDGTLISLIRHSIDFNKPIFGVNMGRVGFLTAIQIDELSDFLSKLKKGDFALYSHLLLKGEIISESNSTNPNAPQNPQTLRCVNEFLITKQNISGMISIEAKINGKYFNTYRADGLIIGTPTGSSAYNISAGGPIVYPYNRNILLTPVCAHSLTQKPLILNDEFSLEFAVSEGNAKIIIDGQDIIDFPQGAKFCVSILDKNAHLIYDKARDYFAVLREKFGWGD